MSKHTITGAESLTEKVIDDRTWIAKRVPHFHLSPQAETIETMGFAKLEPLTRVVRGITLVVLPLSRAEISICTGKDREAVQEKSEKSTSVESS
jgi:hypothetical protein